MEYILFAICLIIIFISLWMIWRLNLYVASLEDTVDELVAKVETLQASLQKAVKNNMIDSDGNFKTPLVELDDDN